jgi:radical SAM protein with 4Fe4S-binding SPASM domain
MLLQGADVVGQSITTAWQQTKENIKQYLLPAECLNCQYQAVCPSCVAVSASGGGNGTVQKNLCRRTEAYAKELLRYAQMQ